MNPTAWLESKNGKKYPLKGASTIGRSSRNTVVLSDEQLSRKHALIQMQGGGEYWLVDLGSSNGTFLNRRRISRPSVLKPGDFIQMGGQGFHFHVVEDQTSCEITQTAMATMLDIQRRPVWLLVVDVIDSSGLAARGNPEVLPVLMGRWFRECREVVEGERGEITQYLGDGFFAYWGDAPGVAGRVLAAARRLDALRARGEPPFRLAVHLGDVVIGGIPTFVDVNLLGPSVNFVFRIEKAAGAAGEGLVCSEMAIRSLGLPTLRSFEVELKGYEGLHRIHVPDLG